MIMTVSNCSIHLVDSCKILPASRHKDFYNELSKEKDIGNTTGDLKKRLKEAITYFDSDPKSSKNSIMNAFFTIESMFEKIDYLGRAFALLVTKYVIDDKETFPEYSDSGLDKTIKDLSDAGVTHQMIESWVLDIKKKLNANWPFIFQKTTE